MGTTKQRNWTKKIFFEALEANGFHITDIEFGNGYFIFEHGKDMVVHFHLKECKGWKFGIWWDVDGEKKFDFFAQYERDIDKFKPSASTIKLDSRPLDDWSMKYVVQICRFIKKHPYRAWAIDQTYARDIWEWDDLKGCFSDYCKMWWKYSVLSPFLHEMLRKKYLKIVNQIFDELKLINTKVIDCNDGGWISYPRYMFTCEGQVGKKLESGNWEIIFEDDLSKKLLKRVQKYNKLHKKIRKFCYSDVDDVDLGENMTVRVVDKKRKKK